MLAATIQPLRKRPRTVCAARGMTPGGTPMRDETIPAGLCQCGCGQKTNGERDTNRARGVVAGQPRRFLRGHYSRTRNVPACGYVVEDRGHTTPCWIWKLMVASDGYGRHGYGQRKRGASQHAHVFLWVARNGPVPDGLELDHLCRVRCCVNPDHLEPVTGAENAQRGASAKVTAADVLAIRASSLPQAALAVIYGLDQSTISRIVNRHTWREI